MASEALKKRILVVDDEPDVVTYLVTLLEDNGYETDSAADGNQAIERVRQRKPDLIALDISMPEKSGIKFYRELKQDPELSFVPVLVVTAVTGYGDDPDVFQKFLSSRKQVPPPEGFIAKPIDQDEILEAIRGLVA